VTALARHHAHPQAPPSGPGAPAEAPSADVPPSDAPAASRFRRAVRLPFLALIRAYQLVISPWTPPSCRFYPSCSQYALIAIERHGVLRGGWLALRRLGRCHPWTRGGVDHVPPARRRGAGRPTPSTPTRGA
jgi:putative membrane protein insertion efficiency factor